MTAPPLASNPGVVDRFSRAMQRTPVWLDALIVAIVCLAAALGARDNWFGHLHVPFVVSGDGTYSHYLIKTVIEHGWYTHNPDLGAPFGATMYDFPVPEPTHLVLIRLLGLFSHDPFFLANLFYLLSFATAGLAAWWALRSLDLNRPLAIAGAFLYAVLPYHFWRLPHFLLASYFAAPIFAAFALRLSLYKGPHLASEVRAGLASLLLLAIAAGSGVYYAFFGCLFMAIGAAIGAVQSRRREPLRIGAAFIAVIVAVIGLSLVPNALYHIAEGSNSQVAQRIPQHAEVFGLRITQMLLPTMGHRLQALAAMTAKYNADTPLVNENSTAALGVLASFGLIASMLISLAGARERFPQIAAAGTLAIAGILYATIGGFGSAFAWLVTPELRGLNRISVFIAFFAIVSTLVLMRRWFGARPWSATLLSVTLMAFAWFDEIPAHSVPPVDADLFARQHAFYAQMQAKLEPSTAVYQLPYMYFPENPRVKGLTSYMPLEPYLHTQGLRWSFGDMRGRAADLWNDEVSNLEGNELLNALAGAGFGAVTLDRRGYADNGVAISKSLAATFGAPLVENADHTIALYRVPSIPMASHRPFVVVGAGRDWYPWSTDAKGNPVGLSKGSADLLIANPGDAASINVQFSLTGPQAQHVRLIYGKDALGEFDLEAGKARAVAVRFLAKAGTSRLRLETNGSPIPVGDSKSDPIAFRIENLAYGPAFR